MSLCTALESGRDDCTIGAISDLAYPYDRLMAACSKMSEARTKARCYYEAGRRSYYAFDTDTARSSACESAEPDYRDLCREATKGSSTRVGERR